MTNFERIKNMSVEEYAKHIFRLIDCRYCPIYCTNGNCKDAIEQWLKDEAEDND